MSVNPPESDHEAVPIAPWQELRRAVAYERHGRGVAEVVFGSPFRQETTFSIKFERPTVAMVVLTEDQEILLTQQYRPGPGAVMYELPGGYMEAEESVLDTGQRELLEETGFVAQLQHAGTCHYNSYSSAIKHCVVGVKAVAVSPPAPDEGERIRLLTIAVPDFRIILRRGRKCPMQFIHRQRAPR